MIVSITAYKRPELLRQCLQSVVKADKPEGFQRIKVSIDWHSREMTDKMCAVCESFDGEVLYDAHPWRMGIANNTRHSINDAAQDTSRIVCVEEDSVISPDALLYADWALDQDGDYRFVNLYSKMNGTSPFRVHEDNELRGAFGWAFRRSSWRYYLEPHWNGKIRSPYGFDWQITHLCYRERWKVLTPELSRVKNTGREYGTYDTPDNWDRTQKDVKIAEFIPAAYELVAHPDLGWNPPDWVQEEMRL